MLHSRSLQHRYCPLTRIKTFRLLLNTTEANDAGSVALDRTDRSVIRGHQLDSLRQLDSLYPT